MLWPLALHPRSPSVWQNRGSDLEADPTGAFSYDAGRTLLQGRERRASVV